MLDADTIDITDTVETLKTSFVTWAGIFLYSEAIVTPGFTWLALPVVSTLARNALGWGLSALADSVIMQSFFLSTAIRKSGQAGDYVNAVIARQSLPTTASEADVAKAEETEMEAFRNFVMVTN